MPVAHDRTHPFIPHQTKKNQFVIFHHMIHPCWTLSAAGSFLLHLLSLFSPHILNDGWHLPPYAAISRVKSPPDTLAYLSSAAQTSKSARASHRDGEAPPGSRHRLQSSRRSPGMKYPFRYVEQGGGHKQNSIHLFAVVMMSLAVTLNICSALSAAFATVL